MTTIATTVVTTRKGLESKELGLPWTATKPGDHNTDGVGIYRLNPSGMRVQVLAVRYQGTIPAMCAEPLASEVIHRVQAHDDLVALSNRLIEWLGVAGDGDYEEEIARSLQELAALR